MIWTHRPTWKDTHSHATDRLICIDGRDVTRVYQVTHGPDKGSWKWSGFWGGDISNHGMTLTMAEALAQARRHYEQILNKDPTQISGYAG